MTKYKIKFNKKRCISCMACIVHCKQKNRTPAGLSLNTLTSRLMADDEGRPVIKNKYQPCIHCQKCVEVCPTGAMRVREKDELVYIDLETCIGCGACIEACPWDVPVLDEAREKAIKCDFCMDRVDAGLDPACVTGCTAKALTFVRP